MLVRRRILFAGMVAVLGIAVTVWYWGQLQSAGHSVEVKLWSDYDFSTHGGKIVVVDVSATWCPPCKTQIGELKTVRESFREEEVAIVSLFYDFRDTLELVQAYAELEGMTWDVVYGPGGGGQEVFPTHAIPKIFVLNRDLEVVHEHLGVFFHDALSDLILQLLED